MPKTSQTRRGGRPIPTANGVTHNKRRNTPTPTLTGVTRFSVSLPADLVPQLDAMVSERNHANRSQAIADMIRDRLIEHHQSMPDLEMAGTITLIYDHHTKGVQSALTATQHDHHHAVVSNLHVHLDHDNCLEVIVIKGKAALIKSISDRLLSIKGVKHGKLTLTAASTHSHMHAHNHSHAHPH